MVSLTAASTGWQGFGSREGSAQGAGMDQGAIREAVRPVQEALLGLQDTQKSMQELLVARMALSAPGGPPSAEAPLATG